jgi:hypothetical protein
MLSAVDAAVDIHELRLLPNGDHLVFTNPVVPDVDLKGLGNYAGDANVLGCVIQEVDPSGALVWTWDILDYFDPAKDTTFPEPSFTPGGGTLVDVFHCNAIDVTPDGDLLVSARNMDTVFLVSRSSGAVLWKMGGPTYSKNDAPYIKVMGDPQGGFHRQHDARLQPDGTISMFDDETSEPGPARAVIYALDVDAGTATMVWQHEGTASSEDMGDFRLLDGGTRIIGWGYGGMPYAFSELDDAGFDVADWAFVTEGAATYRAVKVPLAAFDIQVLRNAVGKL